MKSAPALESGYAAFLQELSAWMDPPDAGASRHGGGYNQAAGYPLGGREERHAGYVIRVVLSNKK
jgi:hypothetical protein